MRFAYADPPYWGLAAQFYGDPYYDKLEAHRDLLRHLDTYDAWAYSLHVPALPTLVQYLPPGARIGAWVKPFASFKPGVDPAYTWEPVFFRSARKWDPTKLTVRDYHAATIAMERGFPGAKPDSFCYWIFELVGAQPDDEFVDLFPGSGAVTRAWDAWRGQHRLALGTPA